MAVPDMEVSEAVGSEGRVGGADAAGDAREFVRRLLSEAEPESPGVTRVAGLRVWRAWAEQEVALRCEMEALRAALQAREQAAEGSVAREQPASSVADPPTGGMPHLTLASVETELPTISAAPLSDYSPRPLAERWRRLLKASRAIEGLAELPPDFDHRRGAGRFIARALGRLVYFLARPLTAQQRRINTALKRDLDGARGALAALFGKLERMQTELDEAQREIAATHKECVGVWEETERVREKTLEVEDETARLAALYDGTSRIEALAREHLLVQQGMALAWSTARTAGHVGTITSTTSPATMDEREVPADLYFALQERFRGSRELVRERLAPYLPKIAESRAATPRHPLLDLGCGRGEWLELLAEQGHPAIGVDDNPAMVGVCRDRGLAANRADLFQYLASRDDAVFGAVTAFHVVEHLPLRRILSFLGEVRRVLRPGGLLILESPNPHSLPAATVGFHCDPTHVRPLPPELLAFVLEWCGYRDVEVRPLGENRGIEPLAGLGPEAGDGPLVGALNRLTGVVNHHLLSPPDYSVTASRGLEP